jgi:hypothetical protein
MWPLDKPLGAALHGHLGSNASALVDGQLGEEAASRAWSHVHDCPPCRRLVEREGWVKRQLSQMSGSEPSERLLGSLYDLATPDDAADVWATVDEIERAGRGRRRVGIAVVGAGSVGAAVLGLSALSGAPPGFPAGTPAASLTGATNTAQPTSAEVGSRGVVRGRLPGWTLRGGSADDARAVGFDLRH